MSHSRAESLRSLWHQLLDATRSYRVTMLEVARADAIFQPEPMDVRIEEQARLVVDSLCDLAVKAFSPPGGPALQINLSATRDRFVAPLRKRAREKTSHSDEAWRGFDPVAVWSFLEQEFADGRGAEAAYRQSTPLLHSALLIRTGKPLKQVAGKVVLEVPVSTETNTYPPHHPLDYYSREGMANLVQGMLAFLSWCNRSDLANPLADTLYSYTRYASSSECRDPALHPGPFRGSRGP